MYMFEWTVTIEAETLTEATGVMQAMIKGHEDVWYSFDGKRVEVNEENGTPWKEE